MLKSDEWVIVDTETTGLRNPICPVEIAAQKMRGWDPQGKNFQVLLNFDVPIEPMAEKIHGYSRDYLRQCGIRPEDGVNRFLEYAGNLPVVAYNLSYDWNRVLEPTLGRLRIPFEVRPGFCALCLTRCVAPSLPNFKLKTVLKVFRIAKDQSHQAVDDVKLLVQFIVQHVGPHLTRAGITGFAHVASCADGRIPIPPLEPLEKGTKLKKVKRQVDSDATFAMGELVGICRMILADKQISENELNFLADWLERCPHNRAQPIAGLFDLLREIVADGVVTNEEQIRLTSALERVLSQR